MDGNRRWAKNKGMLALKGHHAGGEKLKEVVRWVRDADIKHVIFYAFSTENWNRSEEEVSYLLNLIAEFLQKEFENFHKEGGVLHCVGDISRFSLVLQKILKDVEEKTKDNSGPHIYLALNYGGRQEILSAVKKIVAENPKQEDITEEYVREKLIKYGVLL